MTFHVITIFPELIRSYASVSLLGRAQANKLIKVDAVNLRDFTTDRHRTVDDRAFGGGPGMVIRIEPVYRAVQSITSKIRGQKSKVRTVLLSARGKVFDQKAARRLARYRHLIFICGRYEGVDERVAKHLADEELSIGPYVLSGGELPALVVIEAVARHVKGVLGKHESLEEVKGSYPVYTRPEVFVPPGRRARWAVPKVLVRGNHAEIAAWRRRMGLKIAK